MSDEEIARFLRHLAAGYRDKRTGNPLLADALMQVADIVLDRMVPKQAASRKSTAREEHPELVLSSNPLLLEKLNADEVKIFIENPSKTKVELIELAAARFGMPRSKFLRLSVDQVRGAVRSALMHEASLAVIGEEAARYGSRRQS